VGDSVRVARHGAGEVAGVKGDEVLVKFPDGARRTFLSSFLKRPSTRKKTAARVEPVAAMA
jgi:hypothetical protein